MSFIEFLMQIFQDSIDKMLFSISTGIPSDDIDKKNWCIGSGSCFNIYLGITGYKAERIFKNLDVRHCCGRLVKRQSVGNFTIETYCAMESQTGYVHLFMFEINDVLIDERKKKNENLLKFQQWKIEKSKDK